MQHCSTVEDVETNEVVIMAADVALAVAADVVHNVVADVVADVVIT